MSESPSLAHSPADLRVQAERAVDDARELVSICAEAAQPAWAREKQAQLRAITHVVEKLADDGLSVPEELRVAKNRLVIELAEVNAATQVLGYLSEQFEQLAELALQALRRLGHEPTTARGGPAANRRSLTKRRLSASFDADDDEEDFRASEALTNAATLKQWIAIYWPCWRSDAMSDAKSRPTMARL